MVIILRGSFRRRALAAGSRMEAPSPEVGVVLVLSSRPAYICGTWTKTSLGQQGSSGVC
jgi:hypothetical protein